MRPWINLLPLFVVKWIVRRHGELFILGSVRYHQATDGVLVRAAPQPQEQS